MNNILFFLTTLAATLILLFVLAPEAVLKTKWLYNPLLVYELERGGKIIFIDPEFEYIIVEIDNPYPAPKNSNVKIKMRDDTRILKNNLIFEGDLLVSAVLEYATLNDMRAGDRVGVFYDFVDGYFVADVITLHPL